MIYPSTTGKTDGNEIRLGTLESIWIQGKLRMWGRWSYIGGGNGGNMFNHLLASRKITKSAINEVLRRMKKSGISKSDLALYFIDLLEGKHKSSLAFCSDKEALLIDRVVSESLADFPGLIDIIHQRYDGRGMSKRQMAFRLNEAHPEWCLRTCESRIDVWLQLAEKMLYIPMNEAFERNPERFTR